MWPGRGLAPLDVKALFDDDHAGRASVVRDKIHVVNSCNSVITLEHYKILQRARFGCRQIARQPKKTEWHVIS